MRGRGVEEEAKEEEMGDELHNFSARYGECEDTPGNSSCGHTAPASTVRPVRACPLQGYGTAPCGPPVQAASQRSFQVEDDSLPPDQIKTFCEEGTPVCFSRVSSLSSLHSSEARDVDQGRPLMLQSIDTGEMSTSVIENKSAIGVKAVLVDIDHRRNRTSETEKEGGKTVTFDESQQVEETPLMFSRCSSLGSLSSFDTQSVHSSLVSEHSQRASQVVSPSELPDSPSDTMPPSPTRLQSPPSTRGFKAGAVGEPVSSAPVDVGAAPVIPADVALQGLGGQAADKAVWPGAPEIMMVDEKTAKLLSIFHSSIPDSGGKKGSSCNIRQPDNAAIPPRPAQNTALQSVATRRQPARAPYEDYASDTIQTFTTEGTPLNFSAVTSPSCVTEAAGNVQTPPPGLMECQSDNSSLCEETEQQLLNDMIQSAMPKSRTARCLDMERTLAGCSQPSSGAANTAPRAAPAKEARKPAVQTTRARPVITMEVPFVSSAADTTQTFATEGTPNLSAATSLSDLTVDSDSGGWRGGCVSTGSPVKTSSLPRGGAGRCAATGEGMCSEGMDSPRVYGVEGTPTSFSRNDSVSSIEILDEKWGGGQFLVDGPLQTYPHASGRHVIGQSSEDSSVKSENQRSSTQRAAHKDEMTKFQVEDTPISFSRCNSSLSSLASGGRAREPQLEEEPQISRAGSVGSLSAESSGFDPTPSEQALLDQCINAAMPKRRPSRGEDRSRRHSRAPKTTKGGPSKREGR